MSGQLSLPEGRAPYGGCVLAPGLVLHPTVLGGAVSPSFAHENVCLWLTPLVLRPLENDNSTLIEILNLVINLGDFWHVVLHLCSQPTFSPLLTSVLLVEVSLPVISYS